MDLDSFEFSEGEGLAWNRKRISGLKRGVSWLVCHAALAGEELSAITPDSAHQRDFERTFYGGATGRQELDAAGIVPIGMRPLRDLMRREAEP